MSRSTLTPYAHMMVDPDPEGARRVAKQLWNRDGTIVIFPDQLKKMGGLERQLVEAVAAKNYGKRR